MKNKQIAQFIALSKSLGENIKRKEFVNLKCHCEFVTNVSNFVKMEGGGGR